jgi:hypothetical protein
MELRIVAALLCLLSATVFSNLPTYTLSEYNKGDKKGVKKFVFVDNNNKTHTVFTTMKDPLAYNQKAEKIIKQLKKNHSKTCHSCADTKKSFFAKRSYNRITK